LVAVPRVFIAADIYKKNEIQKIQHDLISYLNLERKNVKLVRQENFHFTLVFFGEINNSILDKIVTKISGIEFQSYEIKYGMIGAFPNSKCAKVIWIGLDEETKSPFNQMSYKVLSKLTDLDLKIEKEIIPHITLFRTKGVALDLNLHSNSIMSNFTLIDKIDTISVKKSITTPEGLIYENIITVKGK
jgi:RNA 2',3'-cyclic 3'-phosphodiesterase